MTKIEVKKVEIIDDQLLDAILSKIESIPMDREIDSYEKSIDIEVKLAEEIVLAIEGHITQPYTTQQYVIGDQIAYEDVPRRPRWTEFHTYITYEGMEANYILNTRQGTFKDHELADKIEEELYT